MVIINFYDQAAPHCSNGDVWGFHSVIGIRSTAWTRYVQSHGNEHAWDITVTRTKCFTFQMPQTDV